MHKVHLVRTTILGTDSDDLFDFYATKLGLHLRMRLEDKPCNSVYYLFELGKTQIEIRCIKSLPSVPLQEVTIAFNNSERLKKRLDSQGIKTTEYLVKKTEKIFCANFHI